MKLVIQILVWGFFACAFAFIYYQKYKGKKKYRDVQFENDPNWLNNSVDTYPEDNTLKRYFFHYDKEYIHQGHVVEDENHNIVYEIKVLYNNGSGPDEVDFVNHIIYKTHHHKIGKTVSTSVEQGNTGVMISSSFSFDNEDIFNYLMHRGYDYRFHIKGLAYYIDVLKNGDIAGRIYSSNNGKNLYERETEEVEPKAGGRGIVILECTYRNLDAVILYALIFSKTDFYAEQMLH